MSDAAATDALAAEIDHLTHPGVEESGTHELKVELGAVYHSDAEHGRALASLLLAVHRWVEEQEARTVDVVLDGRRFTIRAPDDDEESK
jgi:alcohol dehydrogenase class IV